MTVLNQVLLAFAACMSGFCAFWGIATAMKGEPLNGIPWILFGIWWELWKNYTGGLLKK